MDPHLQTGLSPAATLPGTRPPVRSLPCEQLLVGPPLLHRSALEHEDLVRALYGREPVSDDERGAALTERDQRLRQQPLALGVEMRGGLVQ